MREDRLNLLYGQALSAPSDACGLRRLTGLGGSDRETTAFLLGGVFQCSEQTFPVAHDDHPPQTA